MKTITSSLKLIAEDLYRISDKRYWENKLKDKYDISIEIMPDVHDSYWIIRQIVNIFNPISPGIIKACGVKKIIIRNDMGPNREKYPNHGYFRPLDRTVSLNADIFYHPDQPEDFIGYRGFLTRPEQTIYHEFGHALDNRLDDISLKSEWLSLSNWSKNPKPGLKKLIIMEKGFPDIIGEYYHDPKAGYTRFYARRNPWDDFADTFAYYVGGLRDKIPVNKLTYFDKLLEKLNII